MSATTEEKVLDAQTGLTKAGFNNALMLLMLLLMVPIILWKAFVFVKLWAWFAVPTFHVEELSMSKGYGILLLYALVVGNGSQNERALIEAMPDSVTKRTLLNKRAKLFIADGIIAPSVWLGIGYLVHRFIQ